jgi:hypothetical protein
MKIGDGRAAWIDALVPDGRAEQPHERRPDALAVLCIKGLVSAEWKHADRIASDDVGALEEKACDPLAEIVLRAGWRSGNAGVV